MFGGMASWRAAVLTSCAAALAACGSGYAPYAGTVAVRAPALRPPLKPPPFQPTRAPGPPPLPLPFTPPAPSVPRPSRPARAPERPEGPLGTRGPAGGLLPPLSRPMRPPGPALPFAPSGPGVPPPLSGPAGVAGAGAHGPRFPAAPGGAGREAAGGEGRPAAVAGGGAGGRPLAGARSGTAAMPRRVAAFRRWKLRRATPVAPGAPAVKPALKRGRGGVPPVVWRVPTADRVIFLTVDDGSEKDRAFVRMVRDLGTPVTAFLADDTAGDDYGYFRALRDLGDGIGNHTVHHRDLPALPYKAQRAEICRQRDILRREFGTAPRLFRPPYGDFDRATLRAAGACGADAVVLWDLEAWPDHLDWVTADHRLRPGDIILTHFRGPAQWDGTMNDMLRTVLRAAAGQGFAVARLEDYL
jgi:peptidoglycan/xylan/chitin deacetylase (PgdA/CDA1 family)